MAHRTTSPKAPAPIVRKRPRLLGDEGAWLAALVLLLPFEPRRPVAPLAGQGLTLVEAAAAVALLALAGLAHGRILALLRRPPPPVLFLAAYAGAHLLSAALAPAYAPLALRFAFRMVAMAAMAAVVAALPVEAWRRALQALVLSATLVAILAVLEGSGVRSVDPFLALFREMPFNVGGARRATAGSEYPNLAAAFVVHGLVAACALASSFRRPAGFAAAAGGLAGVGLLYTYSRGALFAGALALLSLAAALARGPEANGRGRAFRGPLAAPLAGLLALGAAVALFAGGGEVFRLRLATEGTASWYGARYEPEEAALRLRPGETRRTAVRLTNTGSKTWTAREAFHLSYHWYEVDRRSLADGGRTVLPRDVKGGESVVLDAEVKAPSEAGRYLLVWDMVHEHTAWFSGQGVRPGVVPVTVSEREAALPEVVPTPPREELVWLPSRRELWRLAAGMWREKPWTGVGSDNFRRLYGARAGRQFWDLRVYANNTLLEAAATTGTLGLLALVCTLVASAAAAWTAAGTARGEKATVAAAAFALTVGLAVHGTVDYVLAFTGHYLVFGLVVGIAGGLVRRDRSASTPGLDGPTLAHP